MKANELRVGNWVNNNEEDYQITSATITHLEREDSTAKPIPITEIWLKRFGFIQDEDYAVRWYIEDDGAVIFTYDLDDNSVKIANTWQFGKRKFVHEIQNLYYALMQEELKIQDIIRYKSNL